MKNSSTIRAIVALAICTLAVPVLGSQKNPVERQIKGRAHMVMIVDLTDGSLVSPNWGECTLIGRFINEGHGFMDLATGLLTSGYGTVIAANGDEIDWFINEDYPAEVIIDGGTGRFEHATGTFSWTPVGDIKVVYDPEEQPTVMTMTFDYTIEGIITY